MYIICFYFFGYHLQIIGLHLRISGAQNNIGRIAHNNIFSRISFIYSINFIFGILLCTKLILQIAKYILDCSFIYCENELYIMMLTYILAEKTTQERIRPRLISLKSCGVDGPLMHLQRFDNANICIDSVGLPVHLFIPHF